MIGFLTHTGFAHGGNGFEGIQFLIEQFARHRSGGRGQHQPWAGPVAMATKFAVAFGAEKKARKGVGEGVTNIPGVNHPVFKNQLVNKDPREVYLSQAVRGARRNQRLPRLLQRPGSGALRHRRNRQRLLRQHRRGDRRAAAETAVAALPLRRLLRAGAGERRVHGLPVRPHGRMRWRNRTITPTVAATWIPERRHRNARSFREYRILHRLHMRGTGRMTTQDTEDHLDQG